MDNILINIQYDVCVYFIFFILRDEDMLSLASFLSANNNDIALLDDFYEEDNEGGFKML